MSKSLSLKRHELDDIGTEIRKSILPGLNSLISTATNNLIEQITVPIDQLAGKTIPEIDQIMTNLRYETSCKLSDEIRFELANAIVHPDEAHEQHTQEQHVHQAAESNQDSFESQANAIIADETPLAPVFEPSNQSMPISVIRSIILERVDDDTIKRIIHLNAQGMSIAKMRSKGIKLADQVIETIIDDYATDESGDPIEPPNYDDKTIRQVRKLYKNGHTVEYIASRTKTNIDDINVIIEGINELDISPNYATLSMIQAYKAADETAERIAQLCGLRLDTVKLSFNGSQ